MVATPMTPKSFVRQMLDYFGMLPGQSSMQFAAELRALTVEDKREFAGMLCAAGFPCALPEQVAAVPRSETSHRDAPRSWQSASVL